MNSGPAPFSKYLGDGLVDGFFPLCIPSSFEEVLGAEQAGEAVARFLVGAPELEALVDGFNGGD
jgi:hypothetical protein